jgi:hypothetical protein
VYARIIDVERICSEEYPGRRWVPPQAHELTGRSWRTRDRGAPWEGQPAIGRRRVGIEPDHRERVTAVVREAVVRRVDAIVEDVVVELVHHNAPVDRDPDGGAARLAADV